ncbi:MULTISPECIES: Flp pilus assembly protein CpaB [Methylocystis]|uniref:Flp pilus assembly protein CpaB n=1 Tax=Methylocystis TaxID=133 RepID=UPI0019244A6A|nr:MULTISPECIES: Flp pilus assembly protein CpaB [Methylocystis]MBL1257082.1 Flp pilus assembly protein CpaB [Methylocystis sp. Sn-Cys]MDJ0447227.1 Flp pilus assembly protein CpaB [Methylocystis sp. JR02]
MNKAQMAVLGVAVAAGGAAFLMMNTSSPPPSPVEVAAPQPPVNVDQVLVAARDLPYGTEIADADTNWVDWPSAALPPGALTKSTAPNAKEDVKSSYVRIPISANEPVRKERLVKGVTAGLMSTMVSPGKRAVAIDVTLNNTAGGFILPNDRVDVIRTYRDAEATKDLGHEVYGSEVVLSNVRVLAMGQTIEKKGAEPVVTGSTATLELDPRQAELIVLAQRTGQLVLSLRPITDAIAKDASAEAPNDGSGEDTLTVVKHGVPANLRTK